MIVESFENVISLSGALLSNFWKTVHTAISLSLHNYPEGVIVDCAQITECNAKGADTFRDILDFLNKHDARVIVAAVPEPVMEALKDVPEVRSQLPVAKTVEEAKQSLLRFHEDEDDKKRRRVIPKSSIRYMVCLLNVPSDQFALEMACEHAQRSGASLTAVHPILIPRELPLQAPMLDEESVAAKSLESAQEYGENRDVHTEIHMTRARDFASAIEEALDDSPATQIFIPLSSDAERLDLSLKFLSTVLTNIKQTVIFVRERE